MTTKKKGPPSRGPLRSMRVTPGFRDFVLEQLAGVPGLRARAMFGGIGLYAGEIFFGILAADVLYLKVDDTTRLQYEASGASAFKPYVDRDMVMPYYGVPVSVLEDATEVRTWAKRAVKVAEASKPAKSADKRNRKPRSAPRRRTTGR